MLASSFIFGGKGFIRLQKTNIKDEYRHTFFKFSKQCGLSPVAWLTTFNTGNYVRITGRQSGRNDLLKTNLTGVPYSLPLPLFHLQIFSRSLPSRHTPLSERLEQAMFPRRKANDHVSVTFLSSHFRPSLFPLRLRWRIFFFFFNPCPRSHDQCFRNFAFATYQGE